MFSTLNLSAISEEHFHGVAAGYLGYCATVPFEGAEPKKCKQWIADNIAKCSEAGKTETLKIGSVEFSLYDTGNNALSRYKGCKRINPLRASGLSGSLKQISKWELMK